MRRAALRCAPLFLLATALAATTPGVSLNLAQGIGNSDKPFGLGGGIGFNVLFREKEDTQGRLRVEYLSFGKGSGATRNYTDYSAYPAPAQKSYSTAVPGEVFQVAYDWRFRLEGGSAAIVLGVGYYHLNASYGSTGMSDYLRRQLDDHDWQREGATGTFGVAFFLTPRMDLEVRYDHYQPKILGLFDYQGEVNLKPSHLTVALQVRF